MAKTEAPVAIDEPSPPTSPSNPSNYVGTVAGIPVELTEPTLDDMPKLESVLEKQGFNLESLATLPKSEQVFAMFMTMCVKFGDKNYCDREDLGRLPFTAFAEVGQAVQHFRLQLGGEG